MSRLRLALLHHRAFVAWALAVVLAIKVLVPGGYMPALHAGTLTLEICSGHVPSASASDAAAMPAMDGHHAPARGPARPDVPCAFSGLAAPSLDMAQGTLPVGAPIAFARFAAVASDIRALPAAPHLRPPLRGPPPPS